MTSTANGMAVPINALAGGNLAPNTYLVEWMGGATDGNGLEVCLSGCFIYDSTQPVSTGITAFKASVAALALSQAGITVPISNILVIFGVN